MTLVEAASAWLGTPYCAGASVRGVGCDCAGLVFGVGRDLGAIALPELPVYHENDLRALDTFLDELLEWSTVEESHVVVLDMGGCRHLAIRVGDELIHVYGRKYGTTRHPFTLAWRRRVASAWRYRGVNG